MIQIMIAQDQGAAKVITFKLTEPQDKLDEEDELGEFIPDKAVRLGLGGNIFRALGYRWKGGKEDSSGIHRFWYTNVERDRFKSGPLYIQLTIVPDKKLGWKIQGAKQFLPSLKDADVGVTMVTLELEG